MKLGDAKPQTRGEHARLEDLVDLVKMPNNKWVQIRILPSEVLSYRQHWINIIASKTKREVKIPKLCLAHNPATDEQDGECPYCGIETQASTSYLVNVIVRSLQEDAPAKIRITKAEQQSGFKDLNSESWTPVRVMRLPAGLAKKIQELKALNKVKGKQGTKTFGVDHEKFGVDINIKYDENAKGPEKYQVNMAERTALTEEELGYLQYELTEELLKQLGLEDLSTAKKELGRMQIVGASEFDDDDDDNIGKGKKKPAAKGKKKPVDEDDDDLDDDEDDEDDDLPASRGKKPAAKGKRSVLDDDDEDDDDLDDDDDDDEDDDPPPRGKKPVAKKPAAKGKKKPVDEDDDLDDDDEDDDEDDDPPPSRGKKPAAKKPAAKKPASKKKPVDEDDDDLDDEDLDDEDDEDDDPPPSRGKKPAAKKPAAKKPAARSKKPPVDDDDEDDDDLDDEDEDEDDEF